LFVFFSPENPFFRFRETEFLHLSFLQMNEFLLLRTTLLPFGLYPIHFFILARIFMRYVLGFSP